MTKKQFISKKLQQCTLKQLKALAQESGIIPSGDKRKRATWESALMAHLA